VLAQQHAFVEKAYYNEVDKDKKIFCIDINKCRRNILEYSKFDYCLFTCFDQPAIFNGSFIVPGLYYIETAPVAKRSESGAGWRGFDPRQLRRTKCAFFPPWAI
jgi:hypothetical protein